MKERKEGSRRQKEDRGQKGHRKMKEGKQRKEDRGGKTGRRQKVERRQKEDNCKGKRQKGHREKTER